MNSLTIIHPCLPWSGVSVAHLVSCLRGILSDCGRRPCKGTDTQTRCANHLPDVAAMLCFALLRGVKVVNHDWLYWEGSLSQHVIGQIKQKQKELRETHWMERRGWVIMMNNDYTQLPLKWRIKEVDLTYSYTMFLLRIYVVKHILSHDFLGSRTITRRVLGIFFFFIFFTLVCDNELMNSNLQYLLKLSRYWHDLRHFLSLLLKCLVIPGQWGEKRKRKSSLFRVNLL